MHTLTNWGDLALHDNDFSRSILPVTNNNEVGLASAESIPFVLRFHGASKQARAVEYFDQRPGSTFLRERYHPKI